jgi:hypothetical protein
MNDARTMLGFGFILIMCVIVIDSLSGQSFTESGANKLRDEAVSICMGGNDPKSIEAASYNFNACRNNHPIERYLIDWFDYVLFFLFVFPVLFAVVVTTGLSMDSFSAAKPLSKSQQDKLPKSKDGSLTIAAGRAKLKEGFDKKYYIKNTRDVVKRKHICKGDYTEWFQRLASDYIENDAYTSTRKYISKEEVLQHLEWAISTIPMVYTGSEKEIESGKRREKILKNYIKKLEKL